VTYEKAAEILLNTKDLMDGAGISFYSIHFVLQYPSYDAEESGKRPEGRIELQNFLYTDIYEDGMLQRIVQCAQDTEEDYHRQDVEK
jgi:hypothetical protein